MLGIERPIVQAPMAAIPRLAAAVSNAGALGMVTLTWSADTAAVVPETAALTARPFGGNPPGRAGRVSDVVDGILYLESAPYVTGEILHIDGLDDRARRSGSDLHPRHAPSVRLRLPGRR
jgi:NAD(P)H-dependent flavin oxidoreductase YrpB (nitropropane dioxygenase family)